MASCTLHCNMLARSWRMELLRRPASKRAIVSSKCEYTQIYTYFLSSIYLFCFSLYYKLSSSIFLKEADVYFLPISLQIFCNPDWPWNSLINQFSLLNGREEGYCSHYKILKTWFYISCLNENIIDSSFV